MIKNNHYMPLFLFMAIGISFLLLAAILALDGLLFHTALVSQIAPWTLFSTYLFFPGWSLSPTISGNLHTPTPPLDQAWLATGILLLTFIIIFVVYLLALRVLPQRIIIRYVIITTLLLGLLCTCIPAVTSQDVYSYIIYGRMFVLYHLNPLTTLPQAISQDASYQHLYWTDQPSAYGPTYIMIVTLLQWLTILFGMNNLAIMVLALRLLGLAAHLLSIIIIARLIGYKNNGSLASSAKMGVVLAFAWNPLLLFEACVNAHNDTLLLLFVFGALWFFLSYRTLTLRRFFIAIVFLALATCFKITIVLLIPGFLIFLWTRFKRLRPCFMALAIYSGLLVLCYAPFWDNGALFHIVAINPGSYRTVNTPFEFLAHFINSLLTLIGIPILPETGSLTEVVLNHASIVLFILLYGLLLWHTLSKKRGLHSSLQLVRWLASAWLLYCLLGAPWYWPWYATIFIGLFAILEGTLRRPWQRQSSFTRFPGLVRLFSFSTLSLYCFHSWAPFASFVPLLPNFRWAFLKGLWAWLLPFLGFIKLPPRFKKVTCIKL